MGDRLGRCPSSSSRSQSCLRCRQPLSIFSGVSISVRVCVPRLVTYVCVLVCIAEAFLMPVIFL
jgi:hypothetical protein